MENILTLGKLLPTRASEQGNVIVSVRIYIREYGSTLYVGLALASSPGRQAVRKDGLVHTVCACAKLYQISRYTVYLL